VSVRTLDGDLRAAARTRGGHLAVVAGTVRLSYSELDRRVAGLATGLRGLGVQPGDRVAVVMRNSADAAVAIYAILRAGAAFVPLNPTAKDAKLAYLVAHSGATAVICDADVAARIPATVPTVTAGDQLDRLAELDPGDFAEPGEDDLASIIYTSGSTGAPKGVVFHQRNMHFVAGSIVEYLGLHAGDRILCVLPLSHTYGLYQLIMSVRLGATVVLQHGITLPGTVIAALTEERITVLPGVPTVWQVLVSLDGLAARPLPDLRILTNAGAALSVARVEDVRRTFPGAELFSMYGQTECKRVCYLPPDQLDARPGSVGIAIPGTQAWVDAPPGEVGELLVRGEHVMQGYWRDPEASARRLRPDGVLRSGDLFRADDEGFLYFVARMDDIIKTRGEKVAPKEVEEVIYTFDGVHEAAVIGVEDERLGQAVVAHVSAADGAVLDPRALRRHCARNLEDFMVPRDVVIHEALPKMDNGKLDKLALASLPLAS
jgi:long-chain acyl-CoA synthetase